MSIDAAIASKITTQKAPLERFLTQLRIKRVIPHVDPSSVLLDFGCGAKLLALSSLKNHLNLRIGLDSCFKSKPPAKTSDGCIALGSFTELEQLLNQEHKQIETILSLACFEHLESSELIDVLQQLDRLSTKECQIIGTVPTPLAKPILEFLSYKLRLIDPSQIEDHKVYYDEISLQEALKQTNWTMVKYERFQFGVNSFFIFKKKAN